MNRVLLLLILLLPARSWAQASETSSSEAPSGEEAAAAARAALDVGDLISAGTAVDRGLHLERLSNAELITLYELRALLAYADERLGLLEESLAALATLDAPTPRPFPPPLRTRYEELLAEELHIGLALEVVSAVHDGRRTLRVVPVISSDPGHLVERLEVSCALDEEDELSIIASTEQLEVGDPHQAVELHYVVRAFGPGGTLVATRGSAAAPESEMVDALPIDETFLHVTLVTVGAVLVVGAVSVAMAYFATDGFTSGQPTTLVGGSCTGGPCPSSALLSF